MTKLPILVSLAALLIILSSPSARATACLSEGSFQCSPTNPDVIQKCISNVWTDWQSCTYACNVLTNQCNSPPTTTIGSTTTTTAPPLGCYIEGAAQCNPSDSNVLQKCVNTTWVNWQSCTYGCNYLNASCSSPPTTTTMVSTTTTTVPGTTTTTIPLQPCNVWGIIGMENSTYIDCNVFQLGQHRCFSTSENFSTCASGLNCTGRIYYPHDRLGICSAFSGSYCWFDYGDTTCGATTTTTTTVPSACFVDGSYQCDPYDTSVLQKCVDNFWIGWSTCIYGCNNLTSVCNSPNGTAPIVTHCYLEGSQQCNPTNPNVIQKCVNNTWVDWTSCTYGCNGLTLICNSPSTTTIGANASAPIQICDQAEFTSTGYGWALPFCSSMFIMTIVLAVIAGVITKLGGVIIGSGTFLAGVIALSVIPIPGTTPPTTVYPAWIAIVLVLISGFIFVRLVAPMITGSSGGG